MAINAGTILAYLDLDTSKFGSAMQTAQSQMGEFAQTGGGIAGMLDGVGAAATTVGHALTLGVSAPLMGVGVKAVSMGMDFDAQMSRVQAISGATAEEFETLRAAAIQMGADSVFGAADAAQALEYMGMAGWKTEQMIAGLPGIIDLAAASGEDLGSVSDIVTDALTAFGLTANESAHFADVLAAASSNSNTNVGMMGETFKYAAPLAGALGYSVEDCAVAIGLMANAGIKGGQAGTALRGMLTNLSKPTDQIAEAMEKYNISLTDSSGNMLPFSTLVGNLRTTFAGLTSEQKTQLAATLAGQEGMSGLLAIVNASEEDYKKLTSAVDDCEGATKRMAAQMLDNLKGDFEGLSGALEGVALAFSDFITPAIRTVVGWLTKAVDWFGGLDTGVKNTVFRFGTFAAALGPALTIGGKLLGTFSGVLPVIAAVGGAFALIYNHSDRLQGIVAKLKTDGIGAFDSLKNGAAAYNAAIAGGVDKMTAIGRAITTVFGASNGTKINGVISKITKGVQTAGTVIKGTAEGLGEFLGSLIDGEGAAASFENALQAAFGGNVPEQVRSLQSSVADFAAQIKADYQTGGVIGVMQGLGPRIADALKDGWTTAQDGIGALRDKIGDGLALAKDWLAPKAREWMSNLGDAYANAKDYLSEKLPAVREAITNGLQLTKSKLSDTAKKTMSWLGEAYRSGKVQNAIGTLKSVGENIIDKFNMGKEFLTEKAGSLLEKFGEMLGSDEAKEKIGDLSSVAAKIGEKIASGYGSMKATGMKLIAELIAQITDNGFLTSAISGIGTVVTSIADGLGAAAGNIISAGTTIITTLIGSLTAPGFIESTFSTAGEVVARIAGVLGGVASNVVEAATTIGKALIDGIVGLDWPTIFTTAGELVTSIGSVIVDAAANLGTAALGLMTQLVTAMGTIEWSSLLDTVSSVASTLLDKLVAAIPGLTDGALGLMDAIITGISNINWANVGTSLAGLGTKLLDGLVGNLPGTEGCASSLIEKIGQGIGAAASALGSAAGKLISGLGAWLVSDDNWKKLLDLGGTIIAGVLEGIASGLDSFLGVDIGLGDTLRQLFGMDTNFEKMIAESKAQQEEAALQYKNFYATSQQMAGAVGQLTNSLADGATANIDQMMTAIIAAGLNMDYGLDTALPDLHQRAEEMWNALSTAGDVEAVKALFAQNGYDITEALAQSILEGKDSILGATDSMGIDINEMLAESIAETEVTLQKSATDWGRIFGQAIPDGATVGLENGMYVLRSKTGEVIKLVSAVDAKSDVETGNKDTAKAGVDAMTGELDKGETGVEASAKGLADTVTGAFESTPSEMQTAGASCTSSVAAGLLSVQDVAEEAATGVGGGTMTAMTKSISPQKGDGVGRNFCGGVSSGIEKTRTSLADKARSVANSVKSATSGVLNSGTGYPMGRDMVQGVINGAESMRSSLMGRFRSLANAAVSSFRNALQMHSPSVVLTGDGAMMVRSIILGNDSMRAEAEKSMVRLANSMQHAWPGVEVDGTKVTSSANTSGADGSIGGVTYNFNFTGDITVREEADIERISAGLYEQFREAARGGGY